MHTQYPEEYERPEGNRDPKLVQDCLGKGILKNLVEKAHFLMALDDALQKILPPEYRAHCRVMNIEGTSLSISATNAAIATRLRYQGRDLLAQLKEAVPGLVAVTVLNVKMKL